jgi:hypothetical protein
MTPGGESLPFRAVWVLDFEFVAPPGERPDPVCLVAHELRSGRVVRLFREELRARRESPLPTGPDVLHVTFFGSAEWGCYLTLGWPIPSRIVDLFAEFRLRTNFALGKAERAKLLPRGSGLLGAAAFFGIDAMEAAEKEANRALILNDGPWTPETRARVLDYCQADVITTGRLFLAMLPEIDLPRALIRGRYTPAVAGMEHRGVPIDVTTFGRLRDCWEGLKAEIVRDADPFGFFEGASFREDRFNANTVQRRITTASGKVFCKGGRCRCSRRFFFHFDIFRLITRGLIRFRRGSVRSICISQSTPRYHASNVARVLPSHSGSRHFRIWKHPVKESASGSSPAVPAASNISDRITKWPSDNAYNSWITPAGVSLRNCAGLVARRGS